MAAATKLAWLEQRSDDSACDVVCLQELDGSMQALCRLRRWLSSRGYAAAVLPGEGAVNGVAVAWREETVALQGNALAVAERALAVRLTRLADGREFGVAAVHGLHGVEEDCCKQLRTVRRCLNEQEGGILLGDVNRVPCTRLRAGVHELSKEDELLRSWQGPGGCTCCNATVDPQDADLDWAELVEDATQRGATCRHFTRAESRRGQAPRWTARLDQIWAIGAETGGWSLQGIITAEGRGVAERGG